MLDALLAANIDVLVFKGAEYLSRYFTFALNTLNDVDLLVRPEQKEEARSLLDSLGFRQAKVEQSTCRLLTYAADSIAEWESKHYELVPFVSVERFDCDVAELVSGSTLQSWPIFTIPDGCYLAVEVDVHHRVALNIPGAEFFTRSRRSAFGRGESMSAADEVWFTTSRYYTEVAQHGKRSLRDFAYLAATLRCSAVDWDVVLSANQRYSLGPCLYYYLHFLADLVPGAVPPAVLDCLSRAPSQRDWGPQLTPLFGTTFAER